MEEKQKRTKSKIDMPQFWRELNIKNLLAVLGVIGCLAILAALFNQPIPSPNKDLLISLTTLLFREILVPVYRSFFPVKEAKVTKDKED
jgi:hypothetical protein